MKIILAGYMGSGKSRVGARLQEDLGLRFLDLDEEISAREKRSVATIFQDSGEIYFRRKESQVLRELLSSEEDFILALGGGTPCYGKNLDLIKENPKAKMVYLKTGLNTLKNRLFEERAARPLISHLNTPDLLEDFIRKHLFERTFYYNQSDIIVETDDLSPAQAASKIVDRLN